MNIFNINALRNIVRINIFTIQFVKMIFQAVQDQNFRVYTHVCPTFCHGFRRNWARHACAHQRPE